jgi:hypothetical protein
MTTHAAPPPADPAPEPELLRVARFPRLRALAWSGDELFASRGYALLRTKFPPGQTPPANISWHPVASFSPAWWRGLTAANRLTARLLRDGFHALAALPSGALVAAVPGAIVTLVPGENEFRVTHRITRGTRPLHMTTVPSGNIFWGEYFDNSARDEVHIYASADSGATWHIAYTFPKGAIRHVHNIVYDAWENCLWVMTGDYGNECRILRASCDFSQVDVVLQGNQQARAVALIPTREGLYFSSDTPLEPNYVHHLDRQGKLSQLAPLSSSSIFGCRVGSALFFSTMVEPSTANPDQNVRLYGSRNPGRDGKDWQSLLVWKKDRWPMSFFQYGNAQLPDGNNTTEFLAVTTVGVESEDAVTSLYSILP